MSLLDLGFHLMGFVAPALFVAALLAVLSRLLMGARHTGLAIWAQAAINFLAGSSVLTAGLWHFGRDGKMATYAALLVVMATIQWLFRKPAGS